MLNRAEPERYYSADPARIFSGITVHMSRMNQTEAEMLMGIVHSLGGAWRTQLTSDVTHLVTPEEDSRKLQILRAMGAKPLSSGTGGTPQGTPSSSTAAGGERLQILAVHPAWINESVKFNLLVDPQPFAWPLDRPGKPPVHDSFTTEPPFYQQMQNMASARKDKKATDGTPTGPSRTQADRVPFHEIVASSTNKKMLFENPAAEAALLAESGVQDPKSSPDKNSGTRIFKHRYALQGKKILFAAGEGQPSQRTLDVLAYTVKQTGGFWVPPPSDERSLERAVMRADVVITTYRDDPAAMWAFWHGKQIATAAWLWKVIDSGRWLNSLENLLHFPCLRSRSHASATTSSRSATTRARTARTSRR